VLAEHSADLALQEQLQLRGQQQTQQHCINRQHPQQQQQPSGLLLPGVPYSLTLLATAVASHAPDPCLSGLMVSGLAMSGWTLQVLLLLLLQHRKLAAGQPAAPVL
jgi:hypothetical protein